MSRLRSADDVGERSLSLPGLPARLPATADCPECGQPLQELKACGAVDYLCQHGHGLISKKRVRFRYLPLD
ncbi:Protein of uncharacterised function (DUF1407) [Serratia rubidaea]|uniref:Protein of uncharacterized function (DUF1407) n=1 Tax=Serratia rubidaea TaxID=61652 RepID=A0A4U9HNZ0_SERRU|nr:Protein of uncharacterised function (DUF1407) [Serratia rubidaea]